MLGLTLLEEVGMLAGLLIFVVALIVVLRPLKLNVTVKHEREDDDEPRNE